MKEVENIRINLRISNHPSSQRSRSMSVVLPDCYWASRIEVREPKEAPIDLNLLRSYLAHA